MSPRGWMLMRRVGYLHLRSPRTALSVVVHVYSRTAETHIDRPTPFRLPEKRNSNVWNVSRSALTPANSSRLEAQPFFLFSRVFLPAEDTHRVVGRYEKLINCNYRFYVLRDVCFISLRNINWNTFITATNLQVSCISLCIVKIFERIIFAFLHNLLTINKIYE